MIGHGSKRTGVMSVFVFFVLGFTTYMAEQPLQGMELQEKIRKAD